MAWVKCECCGKRRSEHDTLYDIDNNTICLNCIRKYYEMCRECGRYFKKNGYIVCDRCDGVVYEVTENSYSKKPIPRFKNFENPKDETEKNRRYYGMEMEFNYTSASEVRNRSIELYNNRYLYNKHDGSIGSGVEVVTSPLDRKSIEYMLDNFSKSFEYIKSDSDYKENAGLHIHVNKKSISPICRYKVYLLLNNNMSNKEKNILYYLSSRLELNSIININSVNTNDRYYAAGNGSKIYKRPNSRYQALNTNNTHTFEFRLFKSSAEKEEILSYIDIVDSIIEFCNNNGVKDMIVSNYILYLKSTTKNKLLLDKIKQFEDKFGLFEKESLVPDVTEIYEVLKKIKWYEYYKILSTVDYSEYNRRDVCKKLLDDLRSVRNGVPLGKMKLSNINSNSNSRNMVIKEMISTIKTNLLNRIIKKKGNELCA